MTSNEVAKLIAGTRNDLIHREDEVRELNLLFGFDAFVDQIADLIDKRQDFQHYDRLDTIQAFGAKIMEAAGLSTNIEYVPRYTKIGGSAVNMGAAMASIGCNLVYIGCIGYPTVNPVFSDFAAAAHQCYNIADPGQTIAVEFRDGKIMLCNTSPLQEITWDRILAVVGRDRLRDLMQGAQLVATINWTMIPDMNDIWQKLQSEILSQVTFEGEKPLFFMDPTDPEKRTGEDWREAMDIYADFSSRYRTILSINRKEATEVARAYGIELSVPLAEAGLKEITEAIAAELGLYAVVVHPVDGAGAVIDGEYFFAPGPYTSSPILTTGAGDNFNGGFCLGMLLGLTPQQALTLGTATSGYYVRAARSPSWDQLMRFLSYWEANVGQDLSGYA
ncbi:MAG: carbohydrate kinase family protein [Firmicutes bacterium]|nr:carbohydrate kinase family protein [Bacillota bacterium]